MTARTPPAGRVPARAWRAVARRATARRRSSEGPVRPAPAPALVGLAAPLAAKLELTHRCNLRCGFCYTDSPRRTLERPAELSDDQWLAAVDDLLDAGALELLLTGGEPFLRPDLTLEIGARCVAAGAALFLNTNGWFVDATVADRLAALPGLRVHLSLDGACPETHDGLRGVPGSWRRAVGALDLLGSRGVDVAVVHVHTAAATGQVEPLLDLARDLGASTVRLSGVVPVGAAADQPWAAVMQEPRAALARRDRWDPLTIEILDDPDAVGAAGAAILVRPNGDVVPDSRRPVAFGNLTEDDLGRVWSRLLTGVAELPAPSGHVPYRDPDLRRDGRPEERRPATPALAAALERGRAKAPQLAPDLAAARATVERLAMARRHRLGNVRCGPVQDGARHVRCVETRRIHRLNGAALEIFEAARTGTVADVLAAQTARYPSVDPAVLARDIAEALIDLRRRGLLVTEPTR